MSLDSVIVTNDTTNINKMVFGFNPPVSVCEKGAFSQLKKWMIQRVFSAWGIQIGPCLTFSHRFCGSKLISVTSTSSEMRVVFQAARYSSSVWRGFDCKASCTKRSEGEAKTSVGFLSGKTCGNDLVSIGL